MNGAGAPLVTSAIGQEWGFTGRRLDEETGLYYLRARMYDPMEGRFIGRDPAGYVNGTALYSAYFVPNLLDPSGEKWIRDANGNWVWVSDDRARPVATAAGAHVAGIRTGEDGHGGEGLYDPFRGPKLYGAVRPCRNNGGSPRMLRSPPDCGSCVGNVAAHLSPRHVATGADRSDLL